MTTPIGVKDNALIVKDGVIAVGCDCCCGECETHAYSVSGIPPQPCAGELIHTETITIPAKFSLPCLVKVVGGVDDELAINGSRIPYTLTSYSGNPCSVKYEHIVPVQNSSAGPCPGAHVAYTCFYSSERTFDISLYNNFSAPSGYALSICFGGSCAVPPPYGACCEYPCSGCSIEARPQVSQTETNCLALGYGSEEFPPLKVSRTAIFTEITDALPIQWATGYPAALAGMGITRYWIVFDSSEFPWCAMCGGELNTDLAIKYRWRLLYVDCVNEYPPRLKQIGGMGFEPFAGKTQWDGSTYPVSSDGTWQDTEGEEISGCRPEATSINFLPFRGNPYMTCVPICSQTLLDECVVAGFVNPSWYEGATCEAVCQTMRTNNDNLLP